jgi:hypothetical protein
MFASGGTHNYRDFSGDAIESTLAGDWLDMEVIVVDNAYQ